MRYRALGTSGLRVSELILGAMTFGEHGGVGAPIEECRRILDAYAEAGGNTIDALQEPADLAGDQPSPVEHGLPRRVLGAHVGPGHSGRGDHARAR